MSGETFPAGPTPADELRDLCERFPARDSRGYVIGFYIYDRDGARIAGPFATEAEADAHESTPTARRFFGYRVVCGHVFTSRGTIPRERDIEANGAGPENPPAAPVTMAQEAEAFRTLPDAAYADVMNGRTTAAAAIAENTARTKTTHAEHAAQIRAAHTFDPYDTCRCGVFGRMTGREHAAHVDGMIREAAERRAAKIARRTHAAHDPGYPLPSVVMEMLTAAALAGLTDSESAR